MPVKAQPDGYNSVTPYLVVEGAAGLIAFAQQAFGAEQVLRLAAPQGKVGHAELRIGDSKIMVADASSDHPAFPAMLHLYVADVDATFKRAVAAGGTAIREPADQFYGDRSAGVRDRFGNTWWMATHVEDVSHDELERRSKAAMEQRGG